ncbi:chitinase-3-like protein 1 [Littorina saxatilis]|uniref:Chitinase n=1 Tax=Littorina saxatilis TaxID=31220 RepID=A0AAN9AQ49_9CAEN
MGSGVLTVALLLVGFACLAQGSKKLFCYYSSDAQYRTGPGKFLPENIDPTLCTHVIFAFFQPTDDGLGVKSVTPEGLYEKTVALKQKNRNLKVLLAIGGWLIGSKPFLPVIKSQHSISTFARNVVKFLRAHGMDGMDMDWEFPGVRGSTPADKPKFTMLLQKIQDEFKKEAARTGRDKLILTLATAAGSYYITEGYEPTEIVKHPDYLLLMTYNYHGAWENVTGHHSTVWTSGKDTGPRLELSMQWTVDYWLSQGASRDKLILGLATYGMTFTLKNPSRNGILAPAYGGGRGAQYTNEYGIMAYYEVCENLAKHGWTKVWISDQQAPYAYGGDQWVGYDDPKSLKIKVETMINGYRLAGAFVWSVEMDDFRGRCGGGVYPLLKAIIQSMDGGIATPVQRPGQPTFPPALPTQPSPPPPRVTPRPNVFFPGRQGFTSPRPNFVTTTVPQVAAFPSTSCTTLGEGIHKDPNTCSQFFYCVRGVEGSFAQFTMACPPKTAFDGNYLVCVYDSNCYTPA